MEQRSLAGTSVTTSSLGLGCAGLFRLPARSDRLAVLRAAVDAGIRHFDTAPMYGLGRAESELAPLLRSHRDELTVTTKFGLSPTAAGRLAGRVQGPFRAVLSRRPSLQRTAAKSGAGPASGAVGRLLYAATGYDVASAARSLEHSLRVLDTDHIDVFALHDPMGSVLPDAPGLIAYLDRQVSIGTIRCWGIAGTPPPAGSAAFGLVSNAAVVQQPDDVFTDDNGLARGKARITFGCLSRALPALHDYLGESPGAAETWARRIGADVRDDRVLARLLLREAARRNPGGLVLFSTTRPQRVPFAVAAVSGSEDPAESAALRAMVEAAARQCRPPGSPA